MDSLRDFVWRSFDVTTTSTTKMTTTTTTRRTAESKITYSVEGRILNTEPEPSPNSAEATRILHHPGNYATEFSNSREIALGK